MQEARKTNIEAKKKEKQLEAYKKIVEESQKIAHNYNKNLEKKINLMNL